MTHCPSCFLISLMIVPTTYFTICNLFIILEVLSFLELHPAFVTVQLTFLTELLTLTTFIFLGPSILLCLQLQYFCLCKCCSELNASHYLESLGHCFLFLSICYQHLFHCLLSFDCLQISHITDSDIHILKRFCWLLHTGSSPAPVKCNATHWELENDHPGLCTFVHSYQTSGFCTSLKACL